MSDQIVSFDEAYSIFVDRGGDAAKDIYARWEARADLRAAGVVDFVKTFEHRRFFSISRDAFNDVVKHSEHPLRRLSPKNARDREAIRLVENANVPWSFMQLYHRFLEHDGLPTWQSLRTWLAGDGADYLWTPYRQQLGFEQSTDAEKQMIRDGTAWRLRNSYYSALREIDIMISLRDAGLPTKYHMLADALFAVDFWRENRLVSVFIDNEQFKSSTETAESYDPKEYSVVLSTTAVTSRFSSAELSVITGP